MTRTTLDLDASVLEQLRSQARAEGKSLGALASERLAFALAGAPEAVPPARPWPNRRMGRPKVDLHDKEALHRVLDTSEAEFAGDATSGSGHARGPKRSGR